MKDLKVILFGQASTNLESRTYGQRILTVIIYVSIIFIEMTLLVGPQVLHPHILFPTLAAEH